MKRFITLLVIALTAVSCLIPDNGSDPGKPSSAGTVFVEGGLTWPGAVFPQDFRVVALNTKTGQRLEFDFDSMSRDKKYPTGFGYRIPLKPGVWKIWAESRGKKVSFLYRNGVVEVKNRPLKNIHLDQMTSGVP